MEKLRIAAVGIGRKGSGYLPVITTLKDQFELVTLCDQRVEVAKEFGEKYIVPYYTDVEEMLEEEQLDVVVANVSYANNHVVAKTVLENGVSITSATPIAATLEGADEAIKAAQDNNAKLEIGEIQYRLPSEQIKLSLIKAGVFGKVLTAYNDFRYHGYHGVSLIRAFIGFDVDIKRVIGMERQFDVQPHQWRAGQPLAEKETWYHGILEFENGACGIFNWTSLGYGSPLRWSNLSKFFAERGMVVGDDQLAILEDGKTRRSIKVERRMTTVEGTEVLDAIVASTEPEVVWENPFRKYPLQSDWAIAIASELMSIANAVREDKEPEYGAMNARKDREADLAISKSHAEGNIPIELPLR